MSSDIVASGATSESKADKYKIILGASAGASLLLMAVLMLSGQLFIGMHLAVTTVVVLATAFLMAPVFARAKIPSTFASALLGAATGWLISGVVIAGLDSAISKIEFSILPSTWILALAPLLIVAAIGLCVERASN